MNIVIYMDFGKHQSFKMKIYNINNVNKIKDKLKNIKNQKNIKVNNHQLLNWWLLSI